MSMASWRKLQQLTRSNRSFQKQIEKLKKQLKNKERALKARNTKIRELNHTIESQFYK
jgi:hypothetical protein